MNYIDGIVKSIIFSSLDNTYKVIRIETDQDDMIVVGQFPLMEEARKYRFYGNMTINDKYGLQLACDKYEALSHNSIEGVISYLCSPNFKGIGPKTAKKIVDKLGQDALAKIKEDKNVLKSCGIPSSKIEDIYKQIVSSETMEIIFVKLYSYGLTPKMASKIFAKYEENTIKKIEENPYTLLYDIDGFGFLKCDFLANNIGFSLDSEIRITEGILYTLNEACYQKGFTYLSKNQLIEESISLLSKNNEINFTIDMINKAIESLITNNRLVLQNNRYYPKKLYDDERISRERLIRINDYKLTLPKRDKLDIYMKDVERDLGFNLTKLQQEAVLRSLCSKVSVITGGPGTGKTTIVKALLMLYAYTSGLELTDLDFKNKVLLVSPTGKASKRLSISTNMSAETIHKALGYNSENRFEYNSSNTLSYSLVIIDEASMIDISLLRSLLEALNDNVQLVFVGDKNQLPSVGPGDCLREIISSNLFKVSELNEIMRQKADSGIITLSNQVLYKNLDYSIFKNYKDIFFYKADASMVLDNIEKLLTLFISKGGNLIKDIQILCPMYSGICGIDKINEMVSEKFNHETEYVIYGDKKYKKLDKVLFLNNNPELQVMNGDDGQIVSIEKTDEKTSLYISVSDRIVKLDSKDLDQITLGYAISIHKSQGSEYDNVIMPIVSAFNIMLKPKLIYTGITRAKKKLIILGDSNVLSKALYESESVRQTSLFLNYEKKESNIIYINDESIPFDTLGEEGMENISPYDFM